MRADYCPVANEPCQCMCVADGDGECRLRRKAQTPVPPRLTDGELSDLLPEPDGTAEENVTKVQVLPGVWGTEFEEGPAWSEPVVKDFARAIESAVRKQFGVNDE